MAASPPALWPCFVHKEVAGQTLMGTCHLNLCPTPLKYLTRYPTEDILLNIPGHSCITFHHHVLARLGNVVYMGVLCTWTTIQTRNVVIRSKEAEMPRAHSLLSRYHIAHWVLQDSTPTGPNSWSLSQNIKIELCWQPAGLPHALWNITEGRARNCMFKPQSMKGAG